MKGCQTLVSVIIPTYNRKDFVVNAIDSCLNQTYNNIEIIVIDDGSTDGTKDIISEINNEVVDYTWQSNGGVSSARNTGVRKSNGEYIVFLDSDDKLYPNFIERALSEIKSRGEECGAVYTSARLYNSGEFEKKISVPNRVLTKKDLLTNNEIGGMSGKLVKTDVFDTVGYFDEDLPHSEDFDFFLRMLDKYYITGINNVMCEFHDHSGSQLTAEISSKIKGQDLLYQKHRNILGDSVRAKQYYSRGILYADNGKMDKAKANLLKAIKKNKFKSKYHAHYIACISGSKAYRLFIKIKHKIRAAI